MYVLRVIPNNLYLVLHTLFVLLTVLLYIQRTTYSTFCPLLLYRCATTVPWYHCTTNFDTYVSVEQADTWNIQCIMLIINKLIKVDHTIQKKINKHESYTDIMFLDIYIKESPQWNIYIYIYTFCSLHAS